jgi:hypothetical protein
LHNTRGQALVKGSIRDQSFYALFILCNILIIQGVSNINILRQPYFVGEFQRVDMSEAACQTIVLALVTEEGEEKKRKGGRETWMNDWFKKRSIFTC